MRIALYRDKSLFLLINMFHVEHKTKRGREIMEKTDLIKQISEYLNIGPFNDNDLLRFRRDLRRLSILSLEMLLGCLRRLYL